MKHSLAYKLDADDQLEQIGLLQSDLWSALYEGLRYKANLTPHDTNAVKGIGTWNAINRGLADTLVPKGWTRVEPNNFALTVHPNGSLAIAVLASDKATGMREGPLPSNTYPLAGKLHMPRAIDLNRLLIYHQAHFSRVDSNWGSPPLTYFLLHHIADVDTGEMRAELSLATGRSEGSITDWHERIVLSPPRDGVAQPIPDAEEEEPVIVPIIDKSA